MGTLINLKDFKNKKHLTDAISELNSNKEYPPVENYGWKIVDEVDNLPIKYFCPKTKAIVGYVIGNTEYVYLDYKHFTYVYNMSIEDLVLGLEFGTLPDPISVLSSN